MRPELRELLDAVQVQLAEGEVRLESARETIEAEGLSYLLEDNDDSQQIGYAPSWAEPLAEPFFIPEGRNELDAMFDAIDDGIDALFNSAGAVITGGGCADWSFEVEDYEPSYWDN